MLSPVQHPNLSYVSSCTLEPFGYLVKQESQNKELVGPPVIKKVFNGLKRENGNEHGAKYAINAEQNSLTLTSNMQKLSSILRVH